MENLTLDQIINAVNGEIVVHGQKSSFNKISTDTRKIEEGSIFIALKGENFNGNEFACKAVEKGAALCIVDEIVEKDTEKYGKSSILLVRDTKQALLDLAEFYKGTLKNIKIVGITGSTGKTSTKDITFSVLQSKFKVFKTSGNFNNEIGLPLMIFQLDNTYDVAVLEMGMSNLNEIHRMAKVAKPDIAIITNIGISHIENLKTRENILKAKLEITDFFDKNNVLIVNSDNDLLSTISSSKYKIVKTSISGNGEFNAVNLSLKENSSSFNLSINNQVQKTRFNISIPGKHNVENSLLAIACGKEMGISYDEMSNGLKKIEMTSMRLDVIKKEKFTIVDDSYNASPDSMKAAIEVVKNIPGRRKIAVFGTMRELGEEAFNAHEDVGEYAALNGIDLLITVGEFNEAYGRGFNSKDTHKEFLTTEEATKYIENVVSEGDVVLVKASRLMKFENIVKRLKEI
ncbi:UDP-N-acetylmuramoyl-tripeptide--D-alanyl-D-alanine ligase [Clostridium neuense]|uniref:UDP-N-acetylmuramoyl-tripeptide--D-alanyl-D-alanine ligase n=1 Tax=Clostridium neuense TaxID=1728934 RepID=A0ABW8TGF5_9CLOT